MAYYRTCTSTTGKYLSRHKRHQHLRDNTMHLGFLDNDFTAIEDSLQALQAAEHNAGPEQFGRLLDELWYRLRLTNEHLKKILD